MASCQLFCHSDFRNEPGEVGGGQEGEGDETCSGFLHEIGDGVADVPEKRGDQSFIPLVSELPENSLFHRQLAPEIPDPDKIFLREDEGGLAPDNIIIQQPVLEIDSDVIYNADQEGDEEGVGPQDAAEYKVRVEMEEEVLICK